MEFKYELKHEFKIGGQTNFKYGYQICWFCVLQMLFTFWQRYLNNLKAPQ